MADKRIIALTNEITNPNSSDPSNTYLAADHSTNGLRKMSLTTNKEYITAPIRRKNNLVFMFNSLTSMDIQEDTPSSSEITINWVGRIQVVYSETSYKFVYLIDNSGGSHSIVMDNSSKSIAYIKISDIQAALNGDGIPVYQTVWTDYSTLDNDDTVVICGKNQGGKIKDITGILANIASNYLTYNHEDAITKLFGNYSNRVALVSAVIRTYAHIPFTDGSVEPSNGDAIRGATSGEHGVINAVKVTSGDWSTGDAAGYLVIYGKDKSDNDVTPSYYATNPFTKGENITNADGSIIYCKMSSADDMYGGWQEIRGAHESIHISDLLSTNATYITIPHSYGFTKVHSVVACPDEGWNGYTMGMSVGLDESQLYIKKLHANTTTGVITGSSVDYTDLNNCDSWDNIWILGILRY